MTFQPRAWRWGGGTLASVFLTISIVAASAASIETPDPFTVSGVKVAARAESPGSARDLAMAQGRALAWSELFRRVTAQDQWEKEPKLADNELSRLIPSFEVRNEQRNSRRYVAEATFHFSQTEVAKLLRRPNFASVETLESLPMIPLTAGNRTTEMNELKGLSSIDTGMRVFLTADVRFDSLEDWGKIRAQSARVREIAGIDVIGLSAREAEIDLTYLGPIEDLPTAMARQHLKLSNNGGQYTLELDPLATVALEPADMPTASPRRPLASFP